MGCTVALWQLPQQHELRIIHEVDKREVSTNIWKIVPRERNDIDIEQCPISSQMGYYITYQSR